jgi:hypothetical protein
VGYGGDAVCDETAGVGSLTPYCYPNIALSLQNVADLTLQEQFDLAFSYGGVWYFVVDGDKEPVLVSHISDDDVNRQGIARLAKHISRGGTLLLGMQGPHRDYEAFAERRAFTAGS